MPRRTNHLLQLVHQRVNSLINRLEPQRLGIRIPIPVQATSVVEQWRTLEAAQLEPLSVLKPGDAFGPPSGGWQQRWCRLEIPAGPVGRMLLWECDGEATAWIGDRPWAGLDVAHRTCPLPPDSLTLWLDVGTWQTGLWAPGATPIGSDGCRFRWCSVVLPDPEIHAALADLDVLRQLMQQLFADERIELPGTIGYCQPLERVPPLLRMLLGGLDEVGDAYDAQGLTAACRALSALRRKLPAAPWQGKIAAIGQTHIDLVYLWPERVGTAKAVHSCATALRLLESDPEFVFTHSQPLQYRAIGAVAPRLLEEIGTRIRDGRWEVTGGFAVEPDTQLPCGEALWRSLRIGQQLITELSGAPSTVCWLPDTFGYSPCLPALLSAAGIRCLLTTKIAWSPVTRFPWSSFVWRGHDGSEILAHLCPVAYNGDAALSLMTRAAREHREAHLHDEQAVPVGYGDGGGGPNQSMLDRVARLGDLALAPQVRWSRIDAFAERLEADRERLPVHQGELFLEGHVAVGTSQRRMKNAYRGLERALQAWEAVRVAQGGGPIPQEHWERLCFAQFHDALPGTSIPLVFAELVPELERRAGECLAAVRSELGAGDAQLFNPLSFARSVDHQGRVITLPALGTAPAASGIAATLSVDPQLLNNGLMTARFDASGKLIALSDPAGALPLSAPAWLTIAPDFPANYDAWNTDQAPHRLAEPLPPLTLAVVDAGPGRVKLAGSCAIGAASRLTLSYELRAGERHLRMEATIDWQEEHRIVRFVLPTSLRGRYARFGCPFGSCLRVQQPGSMTDEAQWEVPGSRWAAVIADDAQGMAICTRDSYGFSARDGELQLSLLRAPTYPDPRCDRGVQHLEWAVGRHQPGFAADGVMPTAAAAEALYTPAIPCAQAVPAAIAWNDLGSLVPAWACPTTEGSEVRLHEVSGGSGRATLASGRLRGAVDVLGRHTPLAELDYAAYRIVSVALTPR